MSTLSVDTSRSASSTATESPTPLSQRVTVPSLTLSPSAGIVIIVPAEEFAAGAGGGVTGATGAAATGAAATGAAGAGVLGAAALSAIIASSAPTGTV